MNRKLTTRAGIVAVAGSAAAALGLGIAQATTTIPPNTIHGCVTGTTRTLQRVYTSSTAGTTCPAGSFQVIWPNGADQDSSSAATAGSAGLDVTVVTNQGSASYPDGTYVDVQCPSSHPYVLGGGGFINDNSASLRDSYPVVPGPGQFPQGWEIGVTFPAAITGGGVTSAPATVYAVCSK